MDLPKAIKLFFDIVTTHNDEICVCFCVVFSPLGCFGGGGGPKGARAYVVFQPRLLKNGNFLNYFFDIATTYNDEIFYVKHVLALLRCFSGVAALSAWLGKARPAS